MDGSRSLPDAQSAFFVVLLAAFAYLVVSIIAPFSTYLLAAVLLAFLLFPAHRRLASTIGGRPSALLLVVAAVGGAGLSLVLLGLALPADASELSRTIEAVVTRTRIERRLEGLLGFDVPLGQLTADVPGRLARALVGDAPSIASAATHAFLGFVLLLFVVYYLLEDGRRLVEWTKRMLPLETEIVEELSREAYTTTWAVLKGHVLVALVQGVVAGVGLLIVGIPNVLFWTVVMVFLELFPIVGVAAVLGPAVLYLGLTGRLLAAGFLLVYGLTAVAVVDDYLRAFLVDRESSLHSAVILVGVFGGVYAFGIMGLFYGPIVLGLSKVLVRLFDEHHLGGT